MRLNYVTKWYAEPLQDDDIPLYDANSSDEEQVQNTIIQTPIEGTPRPLVTTSSRLNNQESKFIASNFNPDDDNTIFGSGYVIFGLKTNQNLIIRGQFQLEIQRGAILINDCIYHSSSPSLKFLNPISNSLPLIKATQVIDRSKTEDKKTQENEHLFSSDYKSVIKVSNLSTGLENIGSLAPIFKNLFWNFNNISNDDLKNMDDFESAFNYTFIPILKPTDSLSIINFKKYESTLKKLSDLYVNNNLLKILIIGGKNSGKSTLLNLILQKFLSIESNANPLNILDIDPGQSIFSKPESISLSKLHSYQFGNHLSLTSSDIQSVKQHYIGFTSPKDQPNRFNVLLQDLFNSYTNDGLIKNESLLINTPGWIKGYGINLTKTIVAKIKPTHIIYLNSGNLDIQNDEVINLLKDYKDDFELIPLLGNFHNNSNVKYHSSQLRIFKKTSYFHKLRDYKFNFKPLLMNPPLQLSYGDHGVKFSTFLNFNDIDVANNEDFKNLFEGSIIAIHTITKLELSKITNIKTVGNRLPILDSKSFNNLNVQTLKFKCLALIHSIDETAKLLNLYIPEFEMNQLKSKPLNEEFFILRGKSDTPIQEFASTEIIKKFKNSKYKKLPFITFNKNSDLDKAWRVRKNVQRRGQQ
ncbi:hypothetical protein WICMUC_003960 [Wickerhamomyces mucosus]|uniref:Polynucleotide 5'-hydroxyl-kinase GRC3 n=1 Tax=Wickerhamomyces mucosus TaxID=1378264 RepID=A0A9P8PJ30_9ASCO|nr:hypothetical protein WICMUC_003960 [Wickerhamomyces mucosus]